MRTLKCDIDRRCNKFKLVDTMLFWIKVRKCNEVHSKVWDFHLEEMGGSVVTYDKWKDFNKQNGGIVLNRMRE